MEHGGGRAPASRRRQRERFRHSLWGASINDVRAQGGRGVVDKWTIVLISCVIMYVTRGEGVKKSEIFADVIDGSPL